MDKTVPQKQCLQFPTLAPDAMLAVLGKLAEEDFAVLADTGLRVAKSTGDEWRIYLPVRPEKMAGGDKAVEAFRERLKLSYKTQADYEVGREAEQGFSVSLAGTLAPLEAAIMLAMCGVSEDAAAPISREKMIFVNGPEAKSALVIADIIRHGRDVRTAGAHRLTDNVMAGFLVLTDNAQDYGSVSAYLRREDLLARTYAMTPYGLGSGRLWLQEADSPPGTNAINMLAQIIDAARRAEIVPPLVSEIVFVSTSDTEAEVYYHAPETASAAPSAAKVIAAELCPIQPLYVEAVTIRPDKDASGALRKLIHSRSKRVGYQVALEPLQRGVAPGVDVEPLLEKLEDLEHQIAQVTALGAPQQRLMRFTDAQLPAMIDGLRKLPPERLTDGSLLYAAGHSGGRSGPAHYLIYDPAFTFMRIAEARWRAETDPHTISYWLEPFVADAQLTRPTKTRVFVPSGHFLVPSLAHFGGNVDETLRLVLGDLFEQAQALTKNEDSKAYYLFSPPTSQDFRLEVEVLDGESFAPLDQQLYWINDYLLVREPALVSPGRLAEVASALYEGQVAKNLHKDIGADIKLLEDAWSQAKSSVQQEAVDTVNTISGEMDAVSGRMTDLHSYLKQAGREMNALERVAEIATASLKGLGGVMEALTDKDDQIHRSRQDFESRIVTEIKLAEELIMQSNRQIEALKDRIQRIRDWGQR